MKYTEPRKADLRSTPSEIRSLYGSWLSLIGTYIDDGNYKAARDAVHHALKETYNAVCLDTCTNCNYRDWHVCISVSPDGPSTGPEGWKKCLRCDHCGWTMGLGDDK